MTTAGRNPLLNALLGSVGFLAAGLWMLSRHAPAPISWAAIVFGGLGLLAVAYAGLREAPAGSNDDEAHVVLRDPRDYRVDLTDDGFLVTHAPSGDARGMRWSEVTLVSAVAIDAFPLGRISYMVHRAVADLIEVPWSTPGDREFLAALQRTLPDFDNAGVIEASGMLHGFRQLWPPVAKPS